MADASQPPGDETRAGRGLVDARGQRAGAGNGHGNGLVGSARRWLDLANSILDRPGLILLLILAYFLAQDAGLMRSPAKEGLALMAAHAASYEASQKQQLENQVDLNIVLKGLRQEMTRRARIEQAMCLAQAHGDAAIRDACMTPW